ncbi:hypothetical protein AB0M44_47730 [Streptosporangium subroseum]|uniref:hypothetical protein n=1 Tax=Streptosporangium subroseum TaxID=106412 RepID=UPI00342AC1C7
MSFADRRWAARRCLAALAAERLRIGLEDRGISVDVHEGHGVALVSVWTNLLVWTDGFAYRWWTGKTSQKTGRRLYRVHGVDEPATVARCVAQRYEELCKALLRSEDVVRHVL